MRSVLLVDDDPVVQRVYRDALVRHGFDVQTAADGLAAIKALSSARPDLMVLDLMIPKLSGAEVLAFVHSQPSLSNLPVIILSNAYMHELAQDAATQGAQKGLLKVRCTTSLLVDTINEMLRGVNPPVDTSVLLAAPDGPPAVAGTPSPAPASPAPPQPATADDLQARAEAREKFLARAASNTAELRGLFRLACQAKTADDRRRRLELVCRQAHFMAAEAGLAACQRQALLIGAIEALLLHLFEQPARLTASVQRTLTQALDLLALIAPQAQMPGKAEFAAAILLVDDDPLSNRQIISALQQLELQATSVERPQQALQLAQDKHFDLVLLDLELPGMTGFELCQRLRAIPGYDQSLVIYVTGHTDFEHKLRSLDSGAVDLIDKPVIPMELATKVVMHLLRWELGLPFGIDRRR